MFPKDYFHHFRQCYYFDVCSSAHFHRQVGLNQLLDVNKRGQSIMIDMWILDFDWLIALYKVCPRLTSPARHGSVGSLEVLALCVVGRSLLFISVEAKNNCCPFRSADGVCEHQIKTSANSDNGIIVSSSCCCQSQSSLASISMLTMWTRCTQVSCQPFWDTDGHAVHDQCSLRPVPAATVHTDGGTSAWRSLLGTKLVNKTSDSGWRFHSGTDVCSRFNRST